jgi:acetyl-CoA synthetase
MEAARDVVQRPVRERSAADEEDNDSPSTKTVNYEQVAAQLELPALRGSSYAELRDQFRLPTPPLFNLFTACVERHDSAAPALVVEHPDGRYQSYSFGDIAGMVARLANALRGLGLRAGDRVAVLMPQSLEVALTHMAAYRAGMVAVPLSYLFGPDALSYRLADSGARALVTDRTGLEKVSDVWIELPELAIIITTEPTGSVGPRIRALPDLLSAASSTFETAPTKAEQPALLIYTSGTTGRSKGALHAHRVILGNLPGFCLSHNFFPQAEDVFWSPADWAWAGGLFDALLPTWYCGRPILAAPIGHFDPEWAHRLIAKHRVRNTFLFPTALKMMRQSGLRPLAGQRLRSISTGGEAMGEEVLAWGREDLGVIINEFYGQTEANYFVGNCAERWPVRSGSMGRPYPGFDVQVQRLDGSPAAAGEVGEIVVHKPSATMFLEYWQQPEATAGKFRGEWLLTGDQARFDSDGYLWFEGRADDIINSAGYRIGPTEIEDCLLKHPAVAFAAVVGVADATRGEVIKAFLVLRGDAVPGLDLEADLRQHVKVRLAAYQYPRYFEFVDELPMTTSGKIRRNELRRMAREQPGKQPS